MSPPAFSDDEAGNDNENHVVVFVGVTVVDNTTGRDSSILGKCLQNAGRQAGLTFGLYHAAPGLD